VEIRDLGFHPYPDGMAAFWQDRRSKAGRADAQPEPAPGRGSAAPQELVRRIEAAEAERGVLEKRLAAALAAGDHDAGRRLGTRVDRLSRIIERLYEDLGRQ
jgi:hypothetical protein